MTTPTPRWTPETEELVARAQYVSVSTARPDDDPPLPFDEIDEEVQDLFRRDARAILTALADAGVLIPVGGETRQEWGYRYRGFKHDWTRVVDMSRDEAVGCAEEFRAAYAGATAEAQVLRRTVHVGPWREVTDDPA